MDAKARIRQLMQERGMSEYALAKASNLSQSTISNIFRRGSAPTLPTLEAICAGFGITLAQFFGDGAQAVVLTPEQRALFERWIALSPEQKRLVFELIQSMK